MSKFRKCIGTLLLAAILICSLPLVSYAAGITPYWDNTNMLQVGLNFSDNEAACTLYISGKSGTSRITGSLSLKDDTTGKRIGFWSFDTKNSYYTTTKYKDVVSGHTYTLSFGGYVYNASNVKEYVDISLSKENK